MRLAFLGSPPFALRPFQLLLERGTAPVVLVTAPPRRAGRGRKVAENPLVRLAEAAGIPQLRPSSAKDAAFRRELQAFEPDLGLVVSYGQILVQSLLDLPQQGCINLHGSLLPRWRGASPVQAAILAGDEVSGVCLQRMVLELDAGAVLAEKRLPLSARVRADELFGQLAECGAELLTDFLQKVGDGPLPAGKEQDESEVTFCRKLRRQDGCVDWNQTAAQIDRQVRAYAGWPWAQAQLPGGGEVRLLDGLALAESSSTLGSEHCQAPGTVLCQDRGIVVACAEGVYRIDQLQRPGKAALSSADFLHGFSLKVGDRLQ